MFVHRNVGALVPGNDLNALSVLEYAVAHLGVTDIIVAGHYDCGAIRAASSKQDLGTLHTIHNTYDCTSTYLRNHSMFHFMVP